MTYSLHIFVYIFIKWDRLFDILSTAFIFKPVEDQSGPLKSSGHNCFKNKFRLIFLACFPSLFSPTHFFLQFADFHAALWRDRRGSRLGSSLLHRRWVFGDLADPLDMADRRLPPKTNPHNPRRARLHHQQPR
jgi:hypothetical protein